MCARLQPMHGGGYLVKICTVDRGASRGGPPKYGPRALGARRVYCPEDAYEYAVYCQRDENKFFWVYEKGDEVVGFFIATRHTLPWNRRQWISEEELFFILPEHQSPRAAFRFFRAWESWAADLGTHHLLFNPTSFVDHNIDRWDSFCHAIGFQPGGKSYKKVLRHAD
jgi:GNAT superfamily N-acetyltransferase